MTDLGRNVCIVYESHQYIHIATVHSYSLYNRSLLSVGCMWPSVSFYIAHDKLKCYKCSQLTVIKCGLRFCMYISFINYKHNVRMLLLSKMVKISFQICYQLPKNKHFSLIIKIIFTYSSPFY